MLGDKVGIVTLVGSRYIACCSASGLLLLTVLPSRGMPVPVVAAVVTATSSTMVATVVVASSSRCRHCVGSGDSRGACMLCGGIGLLLLVIHSCASVLLANV